MVEIVDRGLSRPRPPPEHLKARKESASADDGRGSDGGPPARRHDVAGINVGGEDDRGQQDVAIEGEVGLGDAAEVDALLIGGAAHRAEDRRHRQFRHEPATHTGRQLVAGDQTRLALARVGVPTEAVNALPVTPTKVTPGCGAAERVR